MPSQSQGIRRALRSIRLVILPSDAHTQVVGMNALLLRKPYTISGQ